ncbi:MAG: hypothetical protein CVV51_00275 [Spirochaetae bacterium HGW-Spirochaetae-7]|nr:MAG: hypothetical protein CVV51_00275 [Spirochaetae bacterium HGW-Spirochaetae-7]
MNYRGLKVYPDRALSVVNQDSQGVAAKGYDMVALFDRKQLVTGSPDFSVRRLDATWYFANEANRAQFSASPDRFMPQYGGYCSWSVANDSELPPSPGDPSAYDFVAGKLYFKYNKMVRFLWRLASAKYIHKADARWPMFQDTIKAYVADADVQPTRGAPK